MKVFKTLPPYPTPVPSLQAELKLFELYGQKNTETFLELIYVPLKKESHVVLEQVSISKYRFF